MPANVDLLLVDCSCLGIARQQGHAPRATGGTPPPSFLVFPPSTWTNPLPAYLPPYLPYLGTRCTLSMQAGPVPSSKKPIMHRAALVAEPPSHTAVALPGQEAPCHV